MRLPTLLLTVVLATEAGAQAPPTPLRARPERTDYREISSYADVMDFVRRASPMAPRLLHPTTFGYTMEGRALPLVVVGRVRDASPAAVRASGNIRVFIEANILARAETRTVERFAIDSQATAANEFQGHHERTLYGRWEGAEVTLPESTVVVTVRQPLGRLAFTLLEPRSDDGVVDWNVLDDVLEGARSYPILRGAIGGN